jgi:hypothetical protein
MRQFALLACVVSASALLLAATPQRRTGRAAAAAKPELSVKCAGELGTGVKSTRRFCDVVVAATSGESITVGVTTHRAPLRLRFDLHNRFAVPPDSVGPAQAFARHTATIAVFDSKAEIGRAVAIAEFRSVADLFDRIAGGGGPRGVKTVAPGTATGVEMMIPSGITSVGIVGVRLEVTTRLGTQMYDTPGRPIAIVSNLRIE